MRTLSLSPDHVAAFARHRQALELCRRFGNIARFRARALREKLKPLGLSRCGERMPHLGVGEFEGFVLTPPVAATDGAGVGPEFAGLLVFGGVSLRGGLIHRAELRNPDVPELQVGLLLRPMAPFWHQLAPLLETTLAGLEAEGYECHRLAGRRIDDPDLREWLAELAEADALLDAMEQEDADADFDTVDAEDAADWTEDSDWVDIEEDADPVDPAVPASLLLLRRLPLDRLPARCGPIVTRFFVSALGPLLAISAPEWQTLLLARDTQDELGEEE